MLVLIPAFAGGERSARPPHGLAGLNPHGGAWRGATKQLRRWRLLRNLLDQPAHPLLLLLLGGGQHQQVLCCRHVVVHWRAGGKKLFFSNLSSSRKHIWFVWWKYIEVIYLCRGQWSPPSCPCGPCGTWCGSAGTPEREAAWTCSTGAWCTPRSWWGSGRAWGWTRGLCGRCSWTSLRWEAAPRETPAPFCSHLRWHRGSRGRTDTGWPFSSYKPLINVVGAHTWNILGISLASARYTSVWVTGLTWKSLLQCGNKAWFLSEHQHPLGLKFRRWTYSMSSTMQGMDCSLSCSLL